MAWENIIVGWSHKEFLLKEMIPADAVFVTSFTEVGALTQRVYVYRIPIYKKKNVRRK